MFTGLIEEVGKVKAIKVSEHGAQISILAPAISPTLKLGDSIATNGVCLTAASIEENGFTADVMPLTLQHTTLGTLKPGSPVNLERAMTLEGRLDGHLVTGHVDAKGTISAIWQDGQAKAYRITSSKDILSRMIDRGSVALDGISLTIQELSLDSFVVSIIPHTAKATSLSLARTGDQVNIETDVIGKYVARLLEGKSDQSQVSMDLLSRTGFL